jgi:hypothetical protein
LTVIASQSRYRRFESLRALGPRGMDWRRLAVILALAKV